MYMCVYILGNYDTCCGKIYAIRIAVSKTIFYNIVETV